MASSPTVQFKLMGADAIVREVRTMGPRVRAAVNAVLVTYAIKVERKVKEKLSHTGSGRVYQRGGVTHRASAPGEPPATDTGRLRASVQYALRQLAAVVFADTEYAQALEYGNPETNLAPRPFFRPVLEEIRDDFLDALRSAINQALG